MKNAASHSMQKWLIAAGLVILSILAYSSVVENGFINLDDVDYVTANPHIQGGLNLITVKWAFSTYDASNWHPLTWLSHALDCQLYGLNPAGHHLTNLILHVCNVLLLFHLLQRLTTQCWPSGFAALLFAIHPMHVESVAWVAERKDELSALFLFLTLLAYACYAEEHKARRPAMRFYFLALVFFALGLLSKPMLVTVPCLLILLDYWPLDRLVWPLKTQPPETIRHWLIEKIPFALLAAASCIVTLVAQSHGHAVKTAFDFPLLERSEHALVAYAWYIEKLFWPVDLSVFYQLHRHKPIEAVLGAGVLILAISAYTAKQVRRHPFLLVGWLWFLLMLVPVIGLVQVGNQDYADRYTYLPYVGLSLMLAWGAQAFLTQWPRWTPGICLLAVIASGSWLWLTRLQVHLWKSAETLFEQAVTVDNQSEGAWWLMGLQYMSQNNPDKASECLQRALAINPQLFYAWNDLGRIQVIKGDYAAAEQSFRTAISEAPDRSNQYNDLADLLAKTGRYPEAITCLQTSLTLDSNQPGIHTRLGIYYIKARMPDKALTELTQAVILDPQDSEAELNLALLYEQASQPVEAAAHFRRTLTLEPDNLIAANNLAWQLATAPDAAQRNGAEAVRLAEHACVLTRYHEPFLLGTLAAAYAESGRFSDAVATARKARELALSKGQNEIATNNERLLKYYLAGHAFHLDALPTP